MQTIVDGQIIVVKKHQKAIRSSEMIKLCIHKE